jgi:hypothetical protein
MNPDGPGFDHRLSLPINEPSELDARFSRFQQAFSAENY